MNYQTFQPHPDLSPVVRCYWTLEIPAAAHQRQLVIPDGFIELFFILGDDVKRYTSGDDFIIQPREMVLGQITEPFYVEPTGYVNTFAVRFYPYGFHAFVPVAGKDLANKETPISVLFGEKDAEALTRKIVQAADTQGRIEIMEAFLMTRLHDEPTINNIVTTTIDAMLAGGGSSSIVSMLKGNLSRRRQLERDFIKRVGISPKQLGKVIRLQTALKSLLNNPSEKLTQVAYDSEYYDQAHFIRDFKEFTGITPKEFLGDDTMALSSLFYKNE